MGQIVVEVMPKQEILDPQGKAVVGALQRQGHPFTDVRQGKRFTLSVDGPVTEAHLAAARAAAESTLSNPIIEDVVGIRVVDEVTGAAGSDSGAAISAEVGA